MGSGIGATADETAGGAVRASLVGAAARTLSSEGGPGGFASDLFGRVQADDVAPYDARSLADLALAAHAHVSTAGNVGPGGSVRLRDHAVARDGRRAEITVLEAVNRNRPFLLDSTLAELGRRGVTPMLVAHPILGVDRGPDGTPLGLADQTTGAGRPASGRESLIHVHLDPMDDDAVRADLVATLQAAYVDVARATDDHDAMSARIADLAAALHGARGGEATDQGEAAAFLDWLADGHFVLLGVDERDAAGVPVGGRPLGILDGGDPNASAEPSHADFLQAPAVLAVTKADALSRVHRASRLDDVRVKRLSPEGAVVGRTRIVGLFTASAYNAPARSIPAIRTKVSAVVGRAGLDPTSHAGRSLLAVLDSYPRDELFQVDPDLLLVSALAIVGLADRPRVRILQRIDRLGGFASVLVYTFKDRTNAAVRARVGKYLATAFGGRIVEIQPDFPEGVLARTRFVVALDGRGAPEPDAGSLEAGVAALTRSWDDELGTVLAESMDGRRSRALATRYADAFSAAYRERFTPRAALGDVAIIEGLTADSPRAVDIGRREGDRPEEMRLQAFSLGRSLPLSDRVPALENLGFRVIDERTYSVRRSGPDAAGEVWIHDMLLARATGAPLDVEALADRLRDALLALSDGASESDGFDRLVVEAGLGWRQAALLRALGRYLRQLRIRYGLDYLASALVAHPTVAADLVALFAARFDPALGGDRAEAQATVRARIEARLAEVASLDEDRILRRFLNLVEAAVRTNLYQADAEGRARGTIAIKFASAEVAGMPLPRPMFEVFVTSPRVEGVHLRFGRVARGGLRWSDRPEDLRTEVLGLVKAQQVKNAVIVPVGAKGGFVVRRPVSPSDRDAWTAEGRAAYRAFVGSLLDVTDNIVDGAVVSPARTVRHDADDPYLVVAADKGTATFSDLANAVSGEREHWLGDAFASGGSHGYDHKRMGITARGAWEAVRRHFREIDVDVGSDPVTVVGIGDMSGDVFGNGMLLSRSLRLVAAFDHRHVFVDPDPDPVASHAERERLFALERSSWDDYDRTAISPGGGVYPRSLKSIQLSPEARAALDVEMPEASPADVIRAILRAPVDLLWFGGVGTYVRATTEGDEQVGDRANDALRVTAADLRAKVVAEGANLGLTQRARVEAARAGVRLNTDAIDNSAGVNTSDVEVNVKVALMAPERDGRLDAAGRDALLAGMTEDVAALVLRNNVAQTLALSLATRRGAGETAYAARTMQALESEGRLRREIEFLPDDDALAERARHGEGLTRPEFAVVMAYAKAALYDALLASVLPGEPHLEGDLDGYFPAALRQRFPDEVKGHRLRREIIATVLANAVVNDCGPTAVSRLADDSGADGPAVARAYVVARDAFGMGRLLEGVDALAASMAGQDHLALRDEARLLLLALLPRLLHGPAPDEALAAAVTRRRDAAARALEALPVAMGLDWDPHAGREMILANKGLSRDAARLLAAPRAVSELPVIVDVSLAEGQPVDDVAATHFAVGRAFDFGRLSAAVQGAQARDDFDRIALARASASLAATHRGMTLRVLREFGRGPDGVAGWLRTRGDAVARAQPQLARIVGADMTVARATVAASLLSDLATDAAGGEA